MPDIVTILQAHYFQDNVQCAMCFERKVTANYRRWNRKRLEVGGHKYMKFTSEIRNVKSVDCRQP